MSNAGHDPSLRLTRFAGPRFDGGADCIPGEEAMYEDKDAMHKPGGPGTEER